MGHRHYAEFSVKPNMASSPKVVMSFLQEMSTMVRPSADEVLCLMQYSYEADIIAAISWWLRI